MGLLSRFKSQEETSRDIPSPFTEGNASGQLDMLTDRTAAESIPKENQKETIIVDVAEDVAPALTEPETSTLRTDNLVKKYGKRTVANHVSIEVTQGEIVGLLGPNGAGKTTTFYMTVGLIEPNDTDITEFPVYKRARNGIGYLAQEASVFRKMSVEDNIRSVLQMTDMSKEEQRDKLESLIAEFRLQKVRKNLGDNLSGGERRRTEIARCLATRGSSCSTSRSPASTPLPSRTSRQSFTNSKTKT